MASLPKPVPEKPFLSLEELWAIRGTPAFDEEYRRQRAAIAAETRALGGPDLIELDAEDVKGWV